MSEPPDASANEPLDGDVAPDPGDPPASTLNASPDTHLPYEGDAARESDQAAAGREQVILPDPGAQQHQKRRAASDDRGGPLMGRRTPVSYVSGLYSPRQGKRKTTPPAAGTTAQARAARTHRAIDVGAIHDRNDAGDAGDIGQMTMPIQGAPAICAFVVQEHPTKRSRLLFSPNPNFRGRTIPLAGC